MNTLSRIKICGLTTVADAKLAVNSGADAIGLVFYEPSPRYVDVDTAKDIARAVGPFVTVVGLFVDADVDQVNRITQHVGLNLLQFHGKETAEYCESFGLPYMKALRMREGLDVASAVSEYVHASAILLDAYKKGVPGGTGESFDWARVPQDLALPIILAGGLRPENVQMAIEQVRPYAVDVSGGLEALPGAKDPQKIKEFVMNVRRANGL